MRDWSFKEAVGLFGIGRRLGVLLIAVAAYCLVVGLLVRAGRVPEFDWGSAASLINTLILGLLMSFRNRAAYDRWWEGRGLWGKLINDSRNLAAKFAAYVPHEALPRSRVAHLIAGFAEALNRQLRGDAFRLRDLPGFEDDEANPPHVPLYIAHRLYDVVAECKRAGRIDDGVMWVLDANLRGLLDVCGGCERIRNTPLSRSYKLLLRTGLFLNVLAEPWLTIPEVGLWGVPVFLLVCFFLFGVELIDSSVEEPFGRDPEDLDLDRYCRTIREGVESCLA